MLHDGHIVCARGAPLAACDFGCDDGGCFLESGRFDAGTEEDLQSWLLCGGPERRWWPRAGALGDQDAGTVAVFAAVDAEVARARARAAAAPSGRGRGRPC